MAEYTLASFLADMTTIFTSMMNWTGTVVSTIVANPLLLAFAAGSFGLIAVGIVKRLMSV